MLPSNEGRGYVLRRIMRRAMRHAQLLGAKEPLMWRLVPALVRQMGEAYPELIRAQPLITETLKLEETRFRKTLERGLGLLSEASSALGKGATFPGDVAFKLYDTYGFPLDLTEDALKSRGIAVDTKAFDVAMNRQKEEARKAWKGSGEAATETIWFEIRERAGATEFLGYDTENAEGEIRAIVAAGKEIKSLGKGEDGQIVVNQTPFYGESGGQVGDTGTIKGPKGATVPRHRHAEKARRSVRPFRRRRGRHLQARRCCGAERRPRAAAAPSAPTTRRRISSTRRCARSWARTWPRRARWWRPSACASTSPIPSP